MGANNEELTPELQVHYDLYELVIKTEIALVKGTFGRLKDIDTFTLVIYEHCSVYDQIDLNIKDRVLRETALLDDVRKTHHIFFKRVDGFTELYCVHNKIESKRITELTDNFYNGFPLEEIE